MTGRSIRHAIVRRASSMVLPSLLVLLSLLSACATGRTDLVANGAVTVDVVQVPHASLRAIAVEAAATETIVSGIVQRLGVYDNAFAGARVYAEAVYPDGFRTTEVDRFLTRLPRFRNFSMIYPDAKFRIVFPQILPEGTTVSLRFIAPNTDEPGTDEPNTNDTHTE